MSAVVTTLQTRNTFSYNCNVNSNDVNTFTIHTHRNMQITYIFLIRIMFTSLKLGKYDYINCKSTRHNQYSYICIRRCRRRRHRHCRWRIRMHCCNEWIKINLKNSICQIQTKTASTHRHRKGREKNIDATKTKKTIMLIKKETKKEFIFLSVSFFSLHRSLS